MLFNTNKSDIKPEEKVNLKSLPLEEMKKKLRFSLDGLNEAEVAKRMMRYILNEKYRLTEKYCIEDPKGNQLMALQILQFCV